MERVSENVFTATNYRGCNPSYVVTSDGVVIIDTPELVTKVVEMKEEALRHGPIRFLINTENHIDHIFGNHWFAGLCPVIGHDDFMQDFWAPFRGIDCYDYILGIIQRYDPDGLPLIPRKEDYIINKPTITFSSRLTLRVGDHLFEVYHTPGHTMSQSAVYVPREKVVIVGDTIFSECQTWLQHADPDSWLRSLEFLRALNADCIIPGHGPVVTKDYIPKQAAIIREWVTAVAVGIARGWSKEECIERISFLDRFPMDIGQEGSGPMVQEMNAANLYDFLTHKGRWATTGV